MWRRRKMRSLLSWLFYRVFSFIPPPGSPAAGTGCSYSKRRCGQSIPVVPGRVSRGSELALGCSISRDWQAVLWGLCWTPSLHEHCPHCSVQAEPQIDLSFMSMGFFGDCTEKCWPECKINKWTLHLMFFLEPDVCYYLLLAVVMAIIFFYHYLCGNWKERAEFWPHQVWDGYCLYLLPGSRYQEAAPQGCRAVRELAVIALSGLVSKWKTRTLQITTQYTHPALGRCWGKTGWAAG